MIGQSAVARSVFMALAVVLGAAAAAGAAAADCVSLQKCANLSEDGSRLACYDGLMRAATADPNEPSKNFWSGPVGQKNPLSKHDALDRATATVQEEIIARCRKQMERFGSAMVKACVDEDLDAYRGLARYPDEHRPCIARCERQMSSFGWSMVQACADEDIEAEKALRRMNRN